MQKLLLLAVLSIFLVIPAVVLGGDIEDGITAYEKKDYKTALNKFKPLAEKGNISAQFNLGVMYDEGQEVQMDYKEAVKWYRSAADQGHAQAQYNLGRMYYQGQGVDPDSVEAYKWLDLSAARGIKLGRENRAIIEKKMTPREIAEAQKRVKEWIEKHKK